MGKKAKGGKAAKAAKGGEGGSPRDGGEAKEADGAGPAPAEPPRESIEVQRRRLHVRTAFERFDRDGLGRLTGDDAAGAIRSLGQFPPEEALQDEILPALIGDDVEQLVSPERFEARLMAMLAGNEFPPEGQEVLLSAFKAIDEENKGFVEVDYIKELLTKMGHPFKPRELDAFLAAAKDASSNRIFYEDFVMLYAGQVDANAAAWRGHRLHSEELLEGKLAG